MAEKIYDLAGFSIPKLALELQQHSMRFALQSNVYGTNTEFLVRVLGPPIPLGEGAMGEIVNFMKKGGTGDVDNQAAGTVSSMFSFKGRILSEPGRPSPHDFLPDPCIIAESANKYKLAQIVNLHTTFSSPTGYNGPVPRQGDFVKVSLKAGSLGPFSLQKAFFTSLEARKNPEQDIENGLQNCGSLLDLTWTQGGGASLSAIGPSIDATLAEANSTVPAEKMVVSNYESKPFAAKLRVLVETERSIWKDKTESAAGTKTSPQKDSEIYKRLDVYWRYTLISNRTYPGPYAQMTQEQKDHAKRLIYQSDDGLPSAWSAVFISYVVYMAFHQAFGGHTESINRFQGSSAHHYYLTESKKRGWKVYSLEPGGAGGSAGKIKADIGDILLTVYKRRGKARNIPSSHGDVVWKIQNNVAYLAGGNISNTVKTSRDVDLDSNGCYKKDKNSRQKGREYPYYVVMKYNPEERDITASGTEVNTGEPPEETAEEKAAREEAEAKEKARIAEVKRKEKETKEKADEFERGRVRRNQL